MVTRVLGEVILTARAGDVLIPAGQLLILANGVVQQRLVVWGLTAPRSELMELRKQAALDAFAASRPGVRRGGPDPELAAARAEIAKLSEALKEMGVRLTLAEGNERWDRVAGSLAPWTQPRSSGC